MELLQALMNTEQCSPAEAKVIIAEMVEEVFDGRDPEEVLFDWGLEPDYVFDLLEYAAG